MLALSMAKVGVIGVSLGAMLALLLASKTTEDYVGSVVSINGP